MSGSPMVSFRIAPLLYARVKRRIESRNKRMKKRPKWSMTDYWLQCVEEDLRKNQRSSVGRPARGKLPPKEVPSE